MYYPVESAQLGSQITQIILKSPDPQTLLATIAKALGEIFQVDTCLIAEVVNRAATNQVGLWCADAHQDREQEYQEQLIKYPMLTDDWVGEEPRAISDLQASNSAQIIGYGLPIKSLLMIRTRFQSERNGLILLGRNQPYEWTNYDRELLGVASEPIAIAISQVHLTQQTLAAARHQHLLKHLSLLMSGTSQLKKILQVATTGIAQALQVNRGFILLLKDTSTLVKGRSSHKLPKIKVDVAYQWSEETTGKSDHRGRTSQLSKQSFWLADSYWCQQALRNAPEPIVVVDGRNYLPAGFADQSLLGLKYQQSIPSTEREEIDLRHSNPPREEKTDESFSEYSNSLDYRDSTRQTSLALYSPTLPQDKITSIFDWEIMPATVIFPLLGSKSKKSESTTILGFLVLQNPQPRPWLPDELDLIQWVSRQVSSVILQNQALDTKQTLVKYPNPTAQLQHPQPTNQELDEKKHQHLEQVQELNQLKEEFMSTMSHELRTPLTTMTLAIRMLRQAKLPSKRREKYLEILEEQCNREIELINDLLSLQQLESDSSHIQPQKIDLFLFIRKLAESFQAKWTDKGLTLIVETPFGALDKSQEHSLILEIDPDSLNRILWELLTNAGKYSYPNTTVYLQIIHPVQSPINQVVFTLTNTGASISPTDMKYIFDKFRRGQDATQKAVQGTGLGLALVKCLVQRLDGTIEVSSLPCDDSQSYLTSFTVTLPQFP
ncbi:ATP-binding protein [Lyngbya aestuarii]|uniref:ATP-binding protein n=1 Tax=Lyngbya aestuarii TaxID=118322 RepID=UPI00403D670D